METNSVMSGTVLKNVYCLFDLRNTHYEIPAPPFDRQKLAYIMQRKMARMSSKIKNNFIALT